MNDHQKTTLDFVRDLISYIAALLGIGTFAGLVNIGVGLLSSLWLCVQVYDYFAFRRPVNRAKLEAARRGNLDTTQPGDLK